MITALIGIATIWVFMLGFLLGALAAWIGREL
jgi:hypothetical protein